ncbi:MAG TPA: DUF6687 family protein [Pirellulales bacterium]|nr:DUF6687 family protein [Pirellulales bacterium]
MMLIDRFEIVSKGSGRPGDGPIIFCDGTGGSLFRPATDLELSHWRPNTTPQQYRAGTSTEICFLFLDNPLPDHWTAAVNNHVDVDGILSVYVLLHSEHAQIHRRAIIEAAEMGDFWGWGEPPAQRAFQGVTRLMNSSDDGREVYEEAFRRIPALIDGTDAEVGDLDRSLVPLRRGVELVEQGAITRRLIDDRLAHYVVPLNVAGDDDDRAAYGPEFNEAISDSAVLWPHVRAKFDRERICVVSVERRSGWFHDVWFPGYLWADTVGLWKVPGLTYHDGMASYDLDNHHMAAAFEDLQRREPAAGFWALGGTDLPFANELQDRFPLAGRFLDEQGNAAVSRLLPEEVAGVLSGVAG